MTLRKKELPVSYKMTKEQVAEAIELLEKGVICEHVAEVYGINVSTLRKYVRGAELYGYSYWSRNPLLD